MKKTTMAPVKCLHEKYYWMGPIIYIHLIRLIQKQKVSCDLRLEPPAVFKISIIRTLLSEGLVTNFFKKIQTDLSPLFWVLMLTPDNAANMTSTVYIYNNKMPLKTLKKIKLRYPGIEKKRLLGRSRLHLSDLRRY